MTTKLKALVLGAIVVCIAIPVALSALREIPSKSPEMLREAATHIVVGGVVRVYSTDERDGKWKVKRFVAELRPETTEKGEPCATDEPLFVRWFSRHWSGGQPPASSNGHYGWTPDAGDRVRVYLAKNAHDGFTPDNQDGGYNVLVPNGFEELKAK